MIFLGKLYEILSLDFQVKITTIFMEPMNHNTFVSVLKKINVLWLAANVILMVQLKTQESFVPEIYPSKLSAMDL